MESAKRSLSIIVPTYREAANLRPLCERVFAATRAAGIDAELLIVDDDSNDGSEEIVRELGREYDVHIHVRKGERGLSSAVVAGFARANHDTLLVMDADLSHPPESVPAVAEPVFAAAADFVVGSRYVGGGRVQEDWPLLRRLNSWGATLLARLLTPVRDPMTGFFCLRKETWQRAQKLNPIGRTGADGQVPLPPVRRGAYRLCRPGSRGEQADRPPAVAVSAATRRAVLVPLSFGHHAGRGAHRGPDRVVDPSVMAASWDA
jgi:dolichol-phosphate mannosyltransferase